MELWCPLCCYPDQNVNSLGPGDIYALVNYVNIGLDNGFSPVQHQAIVWTNGRLLSIRP